MTLSVTRAPSFAVQSGWRVTLPVFLGTLAVVLALFHETALAMAAIWLRSDTYAHGFLVPAIAFYLAWRKRSDLLVLPPGHSYSAIFMLGLAGLAWLLGEVAAVNVVSQFAFTFIVVLTVPAVLGWQVARAAAFPLAFLFFAVPFGDFAMPQLMDWTAKVTILGLRASGVPVHAEGLRFVIPTGSWSVVEACSGVRYLIASVTVGTLYAYLTYQSWRRRLIFIGVSIAVPIVANWMRAYMIVMLGHLSGNRIAVGVDHLIYGWLFFGMVIMAMFWIGGRWREDVIAAPVSERAPVVRVETSVLPTLLAALTTIVVSAAWPLAEWRLESKVATPLTRLEPLAPIPGWQSRPSAPDEWRPRYGNAAASVQQTFVDDGRVAGLFIAYYRNQDSQHKLISSTNVLVSNDDPLWVRVASGAGETSSGQLSVAARSVELQSRDGRRLLVRQWYWVTGRWTTSDVMAKVYAAMSRLVGSGDDAAVIVVYAAPNQPGGAALLLDDFTRAAFPAVERSLQQTMALR